MITLEPRAWQAFIVYSRRTGEFLIAAFFVGAQRHNGKKQRPEMTGHSDFCFRIQARVLHMGSYLESYISERGNVRGAFRCELQEQAPTAVYWSLPLRTTANRFGTVDTPAHHSVLSKIYVRAAICDHCYTLRDRH